MLLLQEAGIFIYLFIVQDFFFFIYLNLFFFLLDFKASLAFPKQNTGSVLNINTMQTLK